AGAGARPARGARPPAGGEEPRGGRLLGGAYDDGPRPRIREGPPRRREGVSRRTHPLPRRAPADGAARRDLYRRRGEQEAGPDSRSGDPGAAFESPAPRLARDVAHAGEPARRSSDDDGEGDRARPRERRPAQRSRRDPGEGRTPSRRDRDLPEGARG